MVHHPCGQVLVPLVDVLLGLRSLLTRLHVRFFLLRVLQSALKLCVGQVLSAEVLLVPLLELRGDGVPYTRTGTRLSDIHAELRSLHLQRTHVSGAFLDDLPDTGLQFLSGKRLHVVPHIVGQLIRNAFQINGPVVVEVVQHGLKRRPNCRFTFRSVSLIQFILALGQLILESADLNLAQPINGGQVQFGVDVLDFVFQFSNRFLVFHGVVFSGDRILTLSLFGQRRSTRFLGCCQGSLFGCFVGSCCSLALASCSARAMIFSRSRIYSIQFLLDNVNAGFVQNHLANTTSFASFAVLPNPIIQRSFQLVKAGQSEFHQVKPSKLIDIGVVIGRIQSGVSKERCLRLSFLFIIPDPFGSISCLSFADLGLIQFVNCVEHPHPVELRIARDVRVILDALILKLSKNFLLDRADPPQIGGRLLKLGRVFNSLVRFQKRSSVGNIIVCSRREILMLLNDVLDLMNQCRLELVSCSAFFDMNLRSVPVSGGCSSGDVDLNRDFLQPRIRRKQLVVSDKILQHSGSFFAKNLHLAVIDLEPPVAVLALPPSGCFPDVLVGSAVRLHLNGLTQIFDIRGVCVRANHGVSLSTNGLLRL